MPTLNPHRLVVVCPLARLAALGAWWAANIDPADDCANWPALNPSGSDADAATHRWCSTALTNAQWRAVVVRVCQIAGVSPPSVATWNGWTRAQQRAWLNTTREGLFAATGIWLAHSDGDGEWDDPEGALTRLAVRRRQSIGG
jgi:hypothetical protein